MKRFAKRAALLLLAGGLAAMLSACGKAEDNRTESGMNYIKTLEYEEALNCFEEAIVAGESLRAVYRGQGLAHLGLTEYPEAIEAFENCLSVSPAIPDKLDYDVNYYLAAAYYKNGEPEKAKEVYDAILAMREKEKDAYYLRGCVVLEMGDYERAQDDFDKAISLDPENFDQLTSIFEALDKFGYEEIGCQYLNAALDKYSKDMSNYDKGRIYYFLSDFDSARNYLEQARDMGDAQATYFLGKTWEELGEYNYAVSVYNSFLKEQGDNALIYNQLALCEMQLGDYESALAAVEAGLKMDDSGLNQTLLFNRVVIYENEQQFSKAKTAMANYLKNYPDDEAAQREYIFLKTR